MSLTIYNGIPIKLPEDNWILKKIENSEEKNTDSEVFSKILPSAEIGDISGFEKEILDRYIGSSSDVLKLKSEILKVARFNVPVLITGETGTGKNLIAEIIHNLSSRRKSGLFRIDCGSSTDILFKSEIFGYVKGAFTDATCDCDGIIRKAESGTLFFDEIGDTSRGCQKILLDYLQHMTYSPVGSNEVYKSDCRIIYATNVRLGESFQKGKLRKDFLSRINTYEIKVPPLRSHKSDLRELCDFFLEMISAKEGIPKKTLSRTAFAMLENHSFPGNIRELESILKNSAVNSGLKTEISSSDILFGIL